MKFVKSIAGINLLIMLVYSLLIRIASTNGSRHDQMSILMASAMFVGLHVLVCIIVAAGMNAFSDSQRAKPWWLSAGLVLLIGFSVCLGNASL